MNVKTINTEHYDSLWNIKSKNICDQFSSLIGIQPTLYASQKKFYRMRAEFRIWHDDQTLHYAMFDSKSKKVYFLDTFFVASELINYLMPQLMNYLRNNSSFSKRLFQIEFLTTTKDEALITLIYHRKLDDEWVKHAKFIENKFKIHVIGRSKKQKIVVSQDYVDETFVVNNKVLKYRQTENGFTQPNAYINGKLLSWVDSNTSHKSNEKHDLIELYCGNGNFTSILANNFNRILATEISKTSVSTAQYNLKQNGLSNVHISRMSSEELSEAISGVRKFRRLAQIPLQNFNFQSVFVDPPRSGLDDTTLHFIKAFQQIIYISCNPQTLFRDLKVLLSTHHVIQFSLFDQFPYTDHTEVGIILTRNFQP